MGGNGAIYSSDYGISRLDWNKLSPKLQEACAKEPKMAIAIARQIGKGLEVKDINAYYENVQIPGLSVEKAEDGDVKPEEKLENLRSTATQITAKDMDDKDLRNLNEAQWEQYFMERYKQNPAEARRDIVRVMYSKEVNQVKAGLQSMMKDTKANIQLKTKYLAEGFATEEEKKRYEERKTELRNLYMNEPRKKYDEQIKKLQDDLALLDPNDKAGRAKIEANIKAVSEQRAKACDKAALDAYNSLRPPHEKVQEKDWVQEGEHLTTEQIEAIIDLKATDAFDITEGKIEEMAISAVSEQNFNKGVAEVQKMRQEIAELKAKNITPEVQRMQNKAIAADNEYADQIAKLLADAETDESKRLRQQAEEQNRATRAEVARLRKAGKDSEAEALDKQRLADKAEAQKAITAALDQNKYNQAQELGKKRAEAREQAAKDAYDALPDKVKNKIEKLEAKIQKTMKEANEDNNKFLTENMDDIAKIMAETQIHKQRAEKKFNDTVVDYNKLDKDIKEWIQETPEDFYVKADENTADYTQEVPVLDDKGRPTYDKDGNPVTETKYWKFSSDLFKNKMLAYSNDNNLDNDEATDAANNADYRADLQDRKKITRDRKGENAAHKFGDRRFAAKCFKAAGIETEGDRTLGLRLAHVGKSMAKGFIAGSAAGLLTEYLSTTKVVEGKFFKLVQYSGTVPWSKMVHYSKTVQGTSQYHDQVVAEGDVTTYVEFDYEGSGSKYVEFGYEGDAHWNYEGDHGYSGGGVVTGNYSGTANGTVPVTHEDYQNGYLIGEYTQNIDVSLPYSGTIDIPYGYEGTIHVSADGTVHYTGTVGGNVDYTYSGKVGGNVTQHYRQVIDVNGEVHWEAVVEDDIEVSGEAEYSGEKEVSGTTRARAKIDMKNVLGLGFAGAISGGFASLPDLPKIVDEGMRQETIRRQVLSEKGVEKKPATQSPSTPPAPPDVPPEEETTQPITPPPALPPEEEVEPPKDKFNAELQAEKGPDKEPVKFTIGVEPTGRTRTVTVDGKAVIQKEFKAHLWPSLYNAYGIKKQDRAEFRKAYRKEILKGKTYFSGKEQKVNPSFKFKGVDLPFDKKAFDATPKDTYWAVAGNTSADSNAAKEEGEMTYTGTASYTLANGTKKTIITKKSYTDPTDAKNDLKAQIINDPTLKPEQQQEALRSIETAKVKPKQP